MKTLAILLLLIPAIDSFAFEPLFDARIDYNAGEHPYSVFSADLDCDTDLDLAVANYGSNNVSILKNNGDGTFQSAVNYGAGDGPHSVFCADLDGDLDLDLAVANSDDHNVSLLFNQSVSTCVQDERDYPKTNIFTLWQNCPNPFNQNTKIQFVLKSSSFVSLDVYNLLGRKVRTLLSVHLTQGHKSVIWDGRDDYGSYVASGVYFYRLKTRDFSDSKKLLLLK